MDINLLRERDNASVFTVSELNLYIKNIFDNNRALSAVTVKGEISNFTYHRSGHLYFSLKDADGQIKAVMFRSHAARLKFMPESGMKVIIHGQVTVFPRDGSYQLYASTIQPDGIGALYLAYEQLKTRLSEEGLFDEAHKLRVPKFPTRIGVITSPTGAAIRDVLNVTGRRYPMADIYVYPALVQGEGAVATLVKGVDYFDRSGLVDVVIIGRGGGSIEDLWAFNDEALARRIYEAKVPVISAVGHETDFTICDFVSDLRAPTPSAAAELATPDVRELYMRLDGVEERCALSLRRCVERAKDRLLKIDGDRISALFRKVIEERRDAIGNLTEEALRHIESAITSYRGRLSLSAGKADALSPLSVLTRGYSIVEIEGSTVSTVKNVKAGADVSVRMVDGSFCAKVSDVYEEKLNEH